MTRTLIKKLKKVIALVTAGDVETADQKLVLVLESNTLSDKERHMARMALDEIQIGAPDKGATLLWLMLPVRKS